MIGMIPSVGALLYASLRQEHERFIRRDCKVYKPSYDEYIKGKFMSFELTLSKDKPWTFKNWLAYFIGRFL